MAQATRWAKVELFTMILARSVSVAASSPLRGGTEQGPCLSRLAELVFSGRGCVEGPGWGPMGSKFLVSVQPGTLRAV